MKIKENLIAEGTMKDMLSKIKKIDERNLDGLFVHKIGENKYQLYIKEREENDNYN